MAGKGGERVGIETGVADVPVFALFESSGSSRPRGKGRGDCNLRESYESTSLFSGYPF